MSSASLPWRLLVTAPQDGALNMALDLALLRRMDAQLQEGARPEDVRPILRLYSWEPSCVSAGRSQVLESAADLSECARLGVDVVQRPTGGRGVFHEREQTFAVVAPAAGVFEGDGVTRAAAVIAEALVAGLRNLGVDAAAARGVPPQPRSTGALREACFATTARSEVVARGRKLCGSAQFRGRAAFLQHGSLPLHLDVELHARVLGTTVDRLVGRAVSLADCLAVVPPVDEVGAALASGFESTLAVRLEPSGLATDEQEAWEHLTADWCASAARWRPAPRVQPPVQHLRP